MKRIVMITLMALCTAALIFAQGIRNDQENRRGAPEAQQPQPARAGQAIEKTSVTGNLTIINGMTGIKKDGVNYLIPGLMRYVGFIDGLKEGAQATIEGIVRSRQADAKTVALIPLKMTLGGKEYELGMPFTANKMRDRQQQAPMHRQHGNQESGPACPCMQGQQHQNQQFPGRGRWN